MVGILLQGDLEWQQIGGQRGCV
ncbi:hypothetical protein LINGRAHAP2_LOCUS15051 [Linum grandiflorum]